MTERPKWLLESDTVLATVNAGDQVSINLPIINPPVEVTAPYNGLTDIEAVPVEIYSFDFSLHPYNSINTSTSHTNRFTGNSTAFADINDFWVRSNGLPDTTPPSSYNQYSPLSKNYVFKIPRQRNIEDVQNHIKTIGFIGVAIDGVPIAAPVSNKIHNFNNRLYTENDVLNPVNYPTNDGSGLVKSDGTFYYNSDPKLLYTKSTLTHSPIIGYAFDGWPIYGPYGFANTNGTGGIRLMTSSYKIKAELRYNGTAPDGSFIEDYEYVAESGTLDQFNGRECKTPEYPNGIYAYFVTVNPYDINEPIYPYMVGPYYKSKPTTTTNSIYPGDMNLSVISYKLPPGLRIEGTTVVGTVYSIKTDSVFRFVIRAENSTGFADRTFIINVNKQSGLLWETPAGALPVGNNKLFPIPMQFNPNYLGPDLKLNNDNLTVKALPSILTSGGYPTSLATYAIKDGMKVMFSIEASTVIKSDYTTIGIATHDMDLTTYLGDTADSFGFWDDGFIFGNSNEIYGGGYPEFYSGSIIDVAVDRQNYLIWMRVNGGDWNNSITANPVTGAGGIDISFISGDVYPGVGVYAETNRLGEMSVKQLPNYEIPFGFTFVGNELKSDVYYVLDNAPIDYQLSVVDKNLALAQDLNFYIPPNGGELPLGISLGSDGRLTGFTQPIFSLITSNRNGNYDMNFYDSAVYDYGVRPNNGFDSFFFDSEIYDYSYMVNIPHKLNRYYQFIVRATDGYYYEDRQFKIYVVGDDHMRSDTTLVHVGTNFFKADVSYLRKPIWLTPNYLGVKRANNYVTIFTTVYRSNSIVGVVDYILDRVNEDGSPSVMPLGLSLDEKSGVIYGSIPYQPAISKTYKFTIRAYRYDPTHGNIVNTPRTFSLDVIGDVEGTITFTTDGDLGHIDADMISYLNVVAVTKIKNPVLIYTVVAGRLPPGITLFNDGTLQGKVNQFINGDKLGLTTVDASNTTFDGGTTNFDRQFIFTVKAQDQLGLSATTKTFSLKVNTPNDLAYSNIYVKPFLPSVIRTDIVTFLNDITIFTPSLIYRPADENFGIQHSLRMLLYPGIETVSASKYVSALGRSYKKKFKLGDVKKAVAKLPGTNTVIYEVIYVEVFDNLENSNGSISSIININNRNYPITVNQGRRDIIDGVLGSDISRMQNINASQRIQLQDRVMSADYNGQRAGDTNKSTIFGNSVTNIRNKIKEVGDSERNYTPLWMITPQTFSGVAQSFTKAIPICYCIPGGADKIILNIKHSEFDFKKINYTIDRVIIDSVTGYMGDKYLMFPAREVING